MKQSDLLTAQIPCDLGGDIVPGCDGLCLLKPLKPIPKTQWCSDTTRFLFHASRNQDGCESPIIITSYSLVKHCVSCFHGILPCWFRYLVAMWRLLSLGDAAVTTLMGCKLWHSASLGILCIKMSRQIRHLLYWFGDWFLLQKKTRVLFSVEVRKMVC